VAVLVVRRALLRIAKNLVSLLGLFELRFGLGIIRIAVRMKFHRELAIGLLDVVVRCVAIDAKYFVKVFFGHCLLQD
jgi:hypothetical protein